MTENGTVRYPTAIFLALVGIPILVAGFSSAYLYRSGTGDVDLRTGLIIYLLGTVPGVVLYQRFVTRRVLLAFGYAALSFIVMASVGYTVGCITTNICL